MLVGEIDVAIDLGCHFDALGVIWLIGGSLASSLLGEPRATSDVDVVADLRLVHVVPFCARLADTYYVDEDTVRWAVTSRRTFNVIQLASMTKVDIYCSTNDALSSKQLERRIFVETSGTRIPICSAEDILLQKLWWFEQGGRVSDRQWRDLLGVLRVHREKLDREYLDARLHDAGLTELFAKLSTAAASP